MSRKYKYRFYYSKKELLREEPFFDGKYWLWNAWNYTQRRHILPPSDGFRWLLFDYLGEIENSLARIGLQKPSQYYLFDLSHGKLHFTVQIPLYSKTTRDSYFESISILGVDFADRTHYFKLNPAILRGNTKKTIGTLTLLYSELPEWYKSEEG